MKKILLLAVILIIALPAIALAAYSSAIYVTENGTDSYDMIGCNKTANIEYMADNGFIGSKGLDTRITKSGSVKPHMLADDKIMFAIPVPISSTTALQFTTGSSNLSAFYIIPGYDGYITCADNSTLELSDNFTVTQNGWVDTDYSANMTLVHKPSAFSTWISDDEEITSTISVFTEEIAYDTNDDSDVSVDDEKWLAQTFTTVGAISVQQIEVKIFKVGAPTGNVTASIRATTGGDPISGDNSVDLVYINVDKSTLLTTPGSFITFTFDTSVTLSATTQYALVLHADTAVEDTEWRSDNGGTYPGGTYFSSTDTGATWGSAAADFMFRIYSSPTVTAINVPSAEHKVVTSANTTHMWIAVDDAVAGDFYDITAIASGVPDNAEDWSFMQNNSLVYADNITIEVPPGTLQLHYEPISMIIGTDLPDRADTVNNSGTFHWGGIPGNIEITMLSMEGDYVPEGEEGEVTTPDVVPVIDSNIALTADGVILAGLATHPLTPIIHIFADITGVYELMFWWIGTLLCALVVTGLAYKYSRGNLIIASIAFGAVIGYGVALGIYHFAMIAVMILISLGAIVLEGRRGM